MAMLKTFARRLLAILLPLLVLGLAAAGAHYILNNKPEARRFGGPPEMATAVDAITLKKRDYASYVEAFGNVGASTQSQLSSRVSGSVIAHAPALSDNGFFEQGDVLVRLEPIDYELSLRAAEASLTQARAQYAEEKARGEAAVADWQRLGRAGKPGALARRAPQLATANASIRAAQAQVERAKLDVARTEVLAPFAGRVLQSDIAIGQLVSPGAPLAQIIGIEALDVRLPLSAEQWAQLDWPEPRLGDTEPQRPVVRLQSMDGQRVYPALLVKTDGQVDPTTRQIIAVARIDAPYSQAVRAPKVGEFMRARIQARQYSDVWVLPRSAVLPDDRVPVVQAQHVAYRDVTVAWSNSEDVIITDGLQDDDIVILTPLGASAEGLAVRATIDGVAPAPPERRGQRPSADAIPAQDAAERPSSSPRPQATSEAPSS